ncbi:MAG: DinB family protein [Gemmatimonadales bacterium]
MFELAALQDLYRHLEWAEAAVWAVALQSPAAIADQELCERLHHIHTTQRVFLEVWTGRPVGKHYNLKFPSLRELYEWATPYYPQVHAYLAALPERQLHAPTSVPWARLFNKETGGDPGPTTLAETLFQVTSHSTYHRGQMNTRLRVLGSAPPLVDYIAWLWRGRPAPQWV